MMEISTEIEPEDESSSSPVMMLAIVAAVCPVVVGTLAAIEGVPPWLPVAIGGMGGACLAILGVITKTQVTPWKDVVAKVSPTGRVLAGPAADSVTPDSMPVSTGDTVEVYKTAA